MSRRSVIVGTGSALPPRRVTNAELAERVDTSHEWIVERTGIDARHIAGDGETTATLATEAARKALAAAGIDAERDRPDRARHRHARPDLPGQRDAGPDRARHRRLHRLRRRGGLHRLPLRAVDRRQYDQGRHGRSRAGDRLGDVQPHPRLGGPRDLRAVRRRRRRGRAEGRGRRRGPAASSPPGSTPTAATTTCSTSTAASRPPARSASCG